MVIEIYEEYSMKRIAIVMRSMVRGGEANSLSQIYEEYSMKRIAIVMRSMWCAVAKTIL